MKTGSASVKVGVTALLLGLVLFGGFRFVYKGLTSSHGYRLYALFRDATGLVDKSQVQIAGLTVGEINERKLADPKEGPYAKVWVRLGSDVPIWSNAAIYKKTASLLGQYYLEIDPGTPESPEPLTGRIVTNHLLKDGDRINNVVEAVTTSDILVQVNETLPILRQILQDVQKVTQGPLQDIAKDVKSGIERNSDAAEKLLKDLDAVAIDIKGITGGKPNQDLRKIMANAADVTEGLKQLVGTGNKEVGSTGEKLRNNLDKIALAIDNLNATLENTKEVTQGVKEGKGTVGRLLNDDTIANNVEQITEDVGGFVRSITRLQTLVGLRSEYNVMANSLKTYVSVNLQSRPDKFFLIELIDDPRGSRSVARTYTTTDDPTKPQTTNTETVTTKDSFRFTFQLAKKLFLAGGRFNLTGRFGIKESTGGIGVDMEVPMRVTGRWFRTFEMRVDLFDFRSNVYPRLKILAALEFFKHLWIVGGVDDIINDRGTGAGSLTGRDYFFGAQLTFTDDDLRGLLTIGGAALLGSAGK